ncbi:MAG TPA: transcriptional regulator NrdR [Chlamydiales bacterium]|nr:transcriptional regulator NrdR [Chlamydiales bacterium]
MRCPYCKSEDLKVIESRSAMNTIRRRRECNQCKKRFTTFETIDLTVQVRKKDGTFEDFNQDKLFKGLNAACRHSKISHDQVTEIIQTIKGELIEQQIREISSAALGQMVMDLLKKIDVVAYIRFSCVYKRFKKIEDLIAAIDSVSACEE